MPDVLANDFPLFPLGLVALPEEVVPLHIFEERYKTMINVCLDEEREFGIVWLSDDGLREIGCACRIEQVERIEDGRMNLLVRGTRPFRVLARQGHLPYPAGVIEFVQDPPARSTKRWHAARTRRMPISSCGRPITSRRRRSWPG